MYRMKRRVSGLFILFMAVIIVGCKSGQVESDNEIKPQSVEVTTIDIEGIKEDENLSYDEEQIILKDEWIEQTLKGMSLEEKVAQMFYVSYETYKVKERPYGGIIFFKRDLETIETTQSMIEEIKAKAIIPFFYGLDEEGGIVTRISGEDSLGGTSVPKAWDLSHLNHPLAVFLANRVIASEIKALGFNMNFAPVADIHSNPNNPIIGQRAFSDNPETVAKEVIQAIQAYEDYNVIPVIKHFPGHGDTSSDSHMGSVSVNHDIQRLQSIELVPFEAAIKDGISVIMMGHILLPNVAIEKEPASLSVEIIDHLLRRGLGYEGVVMTDALNMKAITEYYTTSQVIDLGLEAGLDLFLMPEETDIAYEYLLAAAATSKEVEERIDQSLRRILVVKYKYALLEHQKALDDVIVGGEENRQKIRAILDTMDVE